MSEQVGAVVITLGLLALVAFLCWLDSGRNE